MNEKLAVVRQACIYLILVCVACIGVLSIPKSDVVKAYDTINEMAIIQRLLKTDIKDQGLFIDKVFPHS